MTGTLVLKILRDLRLPLLVVAVLLAGFQMLWVKITQRTSGELIPLFLKLPAARSNDNLNIAGHLPAGCVADEKGNRNDFVDLETLLIVDAIGNALRINGLSKQLELGSTAPFLPAGAE